MDTAAAAAAAAAFVAVVPRVGPHPAGSCALEIFQRKLLALN